jgi:hypothetical protein
MTPAVRSRPSTSFARRHDFLSVRRQRRISNFACGLEAALVVIYLGTDNHWVSRLSIPTGAAIAFWLTFILGFLGYLTCSSFLMGVLSTLSGLTPGWNYEADDEPAWMATMRKYVFYPSGFLTLIAAAIMIEVSGGLVRSPFTPIVFALVLTQQQLGRFTTNSLIAIVTGIVTVVLLAGYEAVAGVRHEPPAPADLAFYILVFAFAVTALCGHLGKAKNVRASGKVPQPTHVALYKMDNDVWLYTLYDGGTRVDSSLPGNPISGLDSAKTRMVEVLDELGPHRPIHWDDSRAGDETTGYIRKPN